MVVGRLKKGLDAVTGDEVSGGDDSEVDETSTAARSRSFDVAPPGYVAPPPGGAGGWLSGFLSSSADNEATSAAVDPPTTAASVTGATGAPQPLCQLLLTYDHQCMSSTEADLLWT